MKKKVIYLLLAGLLVLYFFHLNSSTSEERGVTKSTPLESLNPSNSSPKLSNTSAETEPEEALEANTPEPLAIDQVTLIPIEDLSINSFKMVNRFLEHLDLPEGISQLIEAGDLVSAATLLSTEPENPDHLIALEVIEINCSSLRYDQRYLKSVRQENRPLPDNLDQEEQAFFQEYRSQRSSYTDRMLQTCNDMKVATNLDLDQRRNQLLKLNTSPMAQLIGKMGKLDKEQTKTLVKEYHQQHNDQASLNGFSQVMLNSEKPEDIQQGIDAFFSINDKTPMNYKSLARCLQKQCKELPESYLAKLESPQHWLEKAAEFGDSFSIQSLHREYEQKQQWSESWAWAKFDLALKRSGCYQNPEAYLHNYTNAKRQLKRAEEHLTPAQRQQANQRANQLYLDHRAKAKSWLSCQ